MGKAPVPEYRRFRNTDPPALVEVWNEALTGRGAVRLRNSLPLEHGAFAKPYFDPAGLIVAEEHGVCGFVHAGFGANEGESGLSLAAGVTCVLAVRPAFRRRGIGSELLRRAEDYLRQRGAQTLYAGLHRPLDPFYLGLYGGSELPGVLDSDTGAGAFLGKRGYVPRQVTRVMQRRLGQPVKLLDPRCAGLRQRYELEVEAAPARVSTWWECCVLGLAEPLLFTLIDRQQGGPAATALAYELEGFTYRWGQPAVGVLGLHVRPELRRMGLGKLLLFHVLKYVQDQCFEVVEVQAPEVNAAALQLCLALGFAQVDVGRMYQRDC
jgi:ribosomal protein S18 acetylase RimI-like enzyme